MDGRLKYFPIKAKAKHIVFNFVSSFQIIDPFHFIQISPRKECQLFWRNAKDSTSILNPYKPQKGNLDL